MSKLRYYASVITERHGDSDPTEHLVVVQAESAEEAQRASGLVCEEFHEATVDELDRWDDLTEQPLTDKDAERLIAFIRREARQVGKRRLRDREGGRWDSRTDDAFDINRYKARKLQELIGKLEVIEVSDAEPADDPA